MILVFLICALALPAQNAVARLKSLNAFLALMSPRYEYRMSEKDEAPEGDGWIKTAAQFEEYYIWARLLRAA